MSETPKALAVVAHPDDIEFMMAGTLLLLRDRGWEIHFWNLANGSCGSMKHSKEEIVALRREEAAEAATSAGAIWHEPLFDDLAIFYDQPSLARVSAVVRRINPSIVLTHSPRDYMEDHQNSCRLAVTAVFSKGIPNYETDPPVAHVEGPARVYHTLPHSLQDDLGRPARADCFINTETVLTEKRRLLEHHRSQNAWLEATQGMGGLPNEMETICRRIGTLSTRFTVAEGFVHHNPTGFCDPGFDPLGEALAARYYQP